MTLDDVKTVARSHFSELTDKQDVDHADQLFTPGIAFHDPAIVPDGLAHGIPEVKQFFTVFFKVFPDGHFRIDDFLAEGDRAAIRFTWTGTHRTKFLGVQFKARSVAAPGIGIFRSRMGEPPRSAWRSTGATCCSSSAASRTRSDT